MKNSLVDLNNHLFAQLERLSEEGITNEQLALEMERTKAIVVASREIISNARLLLDAKRAISDGFIDDAPKVLGLDKT